MFTPRKKWGYFLGEVVRMFQEGFLWFFKVDVITMYICMIECFPLKAPLESSHLDP